MNCVSLVTAACLACWAGSATPAAAHDQYPTSIPMRDGESLAADYYLPAPSGAWPVILIQTPYDKDAKFPPIFKYAIADDPLLKSPDYAFVVLDWRGYFGSRDAAYAGSPTHGEDGYDAVEWIAAQQWCDGNVGTWGASALGNVQLKTAAEQPPHLGACVPMVYHYREWYDQAFPGGVYARNRNEKVGDLFDGLNFYRSVPLYSAFWEFAEQTSGDPATIDIPMLHVTGWYDHETIQTIREMDALRCGAAPGGVGRQKLLIGPWSHSHIGQATQGQRSYPAAEDVASIAALELFDYYLRGIDNDYPDRPVVRYFRMNADAWLAASTWPPPTAGATTRYLTPNGGLAAAPPVANDVLTYAADPLIPVPTVWGAILSEDYGQQGPGDVSAIEARDDVLTFTTPALDAPLTIEGGVSAHLFVECDAVDTDLAVRLTEVLPDGRSMLLVDGIRRASLRNGFSEHEWLQPAAPGTVYAVDVNLSPVAVTIPEGHALRISVAPSNYDRFDANPQDGSDFSDDPNTTPVTAVVGLHVGGAYASSLRVPLADQRAPADLDADGVVNARDLARFAGCLRGPGQYCPSQTCDRDAFFAADLDHDGTVGLVDFAAMQQVFQRSEIAAEVSKRPAYSP